MAIKTVLHTLETSHLIFSIINKKMKNNIKFSLNKETNYLKIFVIFDSSHKLVQFYFRTSNLILIVFILTFRPMCFWAFLKWLSNLIILMFNKTLYFIKWVYFHILYLLLRLVTFRGMPDLLIFSVDLIYSYTCLTCRLNPRLSGNRMDTFKSGCETFLAVSFAGAP